MDTNTQTFEKINSDKVRDRIKQDSFDAVKRAIDTVKTDLGKRGFDPKETEPLIKEGARKAVQ